MYVVSIAITSLPVELRPNETREFLRPRQSLRRKDRVHFGKLLNGLKVILYPDSFRELNEGVHRLERSRWSSHHQGDSTGPIGTSALLWDSYLIKPVGTQFGSGFRWRWSTPEKDLV